MPNIVDRWHDYLPDPRTGLLQPVRSDRYGKGLRYRAVYTALDGKQRARSFSTLRKARMWIRLTAPGQRPFRPRPKRPGTAA